MVVTWRTVRIDIDDTTIAKTEDPFVIIDPVWELADFNGSNAEYEASLARFSRPQRLVWAVLWYDAEVCNGGHHQFYLNPTGMVWRDALAGFEAIGLPEAARIMRQSAEQMGGAPSLDQSERVQQLRQVDRFFGGLDDRYYDLLKRVDFSATIMSYIRAHARDFHFSGDVQKPVR